jgi:hypothetical protein
MIVVLMRYLARCFGLFIETSKIEGADVDDDWGIKLSLS